MRWPVQHNDQDGCASQPSIFEEGRAAWVFLQQHQTWVHWRCVGLAVAAGQAEAMLRAHTNQPKGNRYHEENGAFLREYGFDSIDKGARSRLLEVMRNLAAIEAWLEKQQPAKRLRLNHPQAVLSAWKRSEGEKKPKRESKPESCSTWKNWSDEERRAALDGGGFDLLRRALSPALCKEIERCFANPHAERRLAEKDEEEKQAVEEAKKGIKTRAPEKGKLDGSYDGSKSAKSRRMSESVPMTNIGKWRKLGLEDLQALISREQQRSYDKRDTGGLTPEEFKRLDKMRGRAKALAKTAAATEGNTVNGNDVLTEQSTAAMMAAHAAADAAGTDQAAA
jgi:hypothetical protein